MNPEQNAVNLIQYHGPTKALVIATRRLANAREHGGDLAWSHAEAVECYVKGFHAGATTILRHLANPGKN